VRKEEEEEEEREKTSLVLNKIPFLFFSYHWQRLQRPDVVSELYSREVLREDLECFLEKESKNKSN